MISPSNLEAAICTLYHVTPQDLRSKCREKDIVRARQIIWRVLYDTLNIGTPAIGRMYNRDHTTILHGLAMARKGVIAEQYEAFMKIYDQPNKAV